MTNDGRGCGGPRHKHMPLAHYSLTMRIKVRAVPEKQRMLEAIMRSCLPACISPREPFTAASMHHPAAAAAAPSSSTSSSFSKPAQRDKPFKAQAIISNPVTYGHIHVAEYLDVPLHLMFPQPWTPTESFPHPLSSLHDKRFYFYQPSFSGKSSNTSMGGSSSSSLDSPQRREEKGRGSDRRGSGRSTVSDLVNDSFETAKAVAVERVNLAKDKVTAHVKERSDLVKEKAELVREKAEEARRVAKKKAEGFVRALQGMKKKQGRNKDRKDDEMDKKKGGYHRDQEASDDDDDDDDLVYNSDGSDVDSDEEDESSLGEDTDEGDEVTAPTSRQVLGQESSSSSTLSSARLSSSLSTSSSMSSSVLVQVLVPSDARPGDTVEFEVNNNKEYSSDTHPSSDRHTLSSEKHSEKETTATQTVRFVLPETTLPGTLLELKVTLVAASEVRRRQRNQSRRKASDEERRREKQQLQEDFAALGLAEAFSSVSSTAEVVLASNDGQLVKPKKTAPTSGYARMVRATHVW
jgi:hypothetical protein